MTTQTKTGRGGRHWLDVMGGGEGWRCGQRGEPGRRRAGAEARWGLILEKGDALTRAVCWDHLAGPGVQDRL